MQEDRKIAPSRPERHVPLGARTAGNALWNVLPLIWAAGLGLVTIPIVVKHIGVDHFGLFGLFSLLLAPLSLANLGFGDATIKFVAEHAHIGDYRTCGLFIRTTLFLNLIIAIGCGGAIALAGPFLAGKVFHIPVGDRQLVNDCLVLVGLTWAVNQISAVFLAVPPALQAFRLVAVIQIVNSGILAAASIGAVCFGFGLYGYTAANLVSAIFCLGLWYGVSRRLIPRESFFPRLDAMAWRKSLGFGLWRTTAQLGGLASNQGERFILGACLTPQALGFYNLAASLEQRIYIVAYKMSEVLFPLFSTIQSESKERQFSLLLRATWLATTLAVCGLAPLAGLAGPLMTAWINVEAGQQAKLVLQLLSVAGILGCATNASSFFLLGTGRTKWSAVLGIATGATTVAVAALVLPHYGLRGAAVAAVSSMLVQQAILGLYMIPRVFGKAFSAGPFLVSFYAPVIIGLTEAFVIARIPFFHGLSLVFLLGIYPVLSGICGLIIIASHWRRSSQSIYTKDISTLLVFFGRKIRNGL